MLKTSFHLINVILMGMCSLFKGMSRPVSATIGQGSKQGASETVSHEVDIVNFINSHNDLCIYDVGPANNTIEIVEYAP